MCECMCMYIYIYIVLLWLRYSVYSVCFIYSFLCTYLTIYIFISTSTTPSLTHIHTHAHTLYRLAMIDIGKILGKVDVEELLDIIFRDFCIGK